MPHLDRQRCVEAIDERRKLAQSGWPNAGGQLQPERRYPSPHWQQQPLEGLRLLQRRPQLAGLADIPGKLGTEAAARKSVVSGQSVSVRVDLVARRLIKLHTLPSLYTLDTMS